MALQKIRTTLCLSDLFIFLKDNAFTVGKRNVVFQIRYVKGVPLVNKRCAEGGRFSAKKMVHKSVRGLTSGRGLPV